jgi:hypothetical protein
MNEKQTAPDSGASPAGDGYSVSPGRKSGWFAVWQGEKKLREFPTERKAWQHIADLGGLVGMMKYGYLPGITGKGG